MECFKVGFGWGGRRGRHVAFVFLHVEGGLGGNSGGSEVMGVL